jgi:hypothetical protein
MAGFPLDSGVCAGPHNLLIHQILIAAAARQAKFSGFAITVRGRAPFDCCRVVAPLGGNVPKGE